MQLQNKLEFKNGWRLSIFYVNRPTINSKKQIQAPPLEAIGKLSRGKISDKAGSEKLRISEKKIDELKLL